MAYVLMTWTAHLPVHGRAYSAAILKPFVANSRGSSWLADASKPHLCGVAWCPLMRAHLRMRWARIACRASTRHAARLYLARVLPSEIIARILDMAQKKPQTDTLETGPCEYVAHADPRAFFYGDLPREVNVAPTAELDHPHGRHGG